MSCIVLQVMRCCHSNTCGVSAINGISHLSPHQRFDWSCGYYFAAVKNVAPSSKYLRDSANSATQRDPNSVSNDMRYWKEIVLTMDACGETIEKI